MAIQTNTEKLEQVQAAIAKIECGAQSYTIGEGGASRQVTRANLSDLYQREKELLWLVSREQNGGGIRVSYGMPK